MSTEEKSHNVGKVPVRKIAKWALIGVLSVWVAVALLFGLRVATASLVGWGEAYILIQSAPFRVEAYQYFFNQCASIQGLEGKIDELTAQLNQMERGTREFNYTLSSLTGAKGLRREAIAKYNQDAQKGYTEGQFRDKALPYQLADNGYPSASGVIPPNGGKTTCAVR